MRYVYAISIVYCVMYAFIRVYYYVCYMNHVVCVVRRVLRCVYCVHCCVMSDVLCTWCIVYVTLCIMLCAFGVDNELLYWLSCVMCIMHCGCCW